MPNPKKNYWRQIPSPPKTGYIAKAKLIVPKPKAKTDQPVYLVGVF
jgi:hypothetical protein